MHFRNSGFHSIPCKLSKNLLYSLQKPSLVSVSGCCMFLLCHWILLGSRVCSRWKTPPSTHNHTETSRASKINASRKREDFPNLMSGWLGYRQTKMDYSRTAWMNICHTTWHAIHSKCYNEQIKVTELWLFCLFGCTVICLYG